ncbi:type VI secretion system lipoprotein TssJ [Cupriavidus sp. UME77]|uniref:type VI secretion system lipoprotein TssJ n=1 Tax=Cupriavidus sp. UME77 TaxID=1862321 RepID=UPI0016000B37|nr:type VI secretion system lipoprotein TssJ [Cupriavidus sp. UME77]MBB1629491.1 type VI secretion system-associated lipoprotein [Cupriavidus sp. UME77]
MRRQLRNGALLLVATHIAGCGVGQAVKDSTVEAAKWAFTTQVKTMSLDLTSRSSLNTNGAGQSLSTVVRIYQLKSPQAFEQLSYARLQANDLELLKPDLLATKDVILRPDASVSLSEPMHAEAEYVGVIALFRSPGKETVWKLVVPKKQWKKTDPVRIEVRGSTLELVGVAVYGRDVKHGGGFGRPATVQAAARLQMSRHAG